MGKLKIEESKPQVNKAKSASQLKSKRLSNLFLLLVAVAAGFCGGYFGARSNSYNNQSIEAKQQIISNESQLVNSIAKNSGASVVSISVSGQTDSQQTLFGFSVPQVTKAAGTGIVLTKDGLIITNRHVVSGKTTSVSVTLADGTELKDVEVLGSTNASDPLDIAFLKIKDLKGKTLTPATLGDSSKVQVGDKVVAIGNALGRFQNTVTSGIISGYGRDVQAGDGSSFSSGSTESLQNLFQTDTAINPGNSGGPLVNINGEVIGVNVAMADAQNIGFAIPINDVKGLIASVEKTGKIERPYLGIRFVALTDDLAYFYNLDIKRGAYIAPSQTAQAPVITDSPADKAGLKEKDIITEIDGVKVDEKNSLVSILGRHNVGDRVKLKVHRGDKDIFIDVTLEANPGQ